jgi:hypothetical protein
MTAGSWAITRSPDIFEALMSFTFPKYIYIAFNFLG